MFLEKKNFEVVFAQIYFERGFTTAVIRYGSISLSSLLFINLIHIFLYILFGQLILIRLHADLRP